MGHLELTASQAAALLPQGFASALVFVVGGDTHDRAQFERLSDHGVVLADGRVAAPGTTQALIGVPGGVARLVENPCPGS